MDMKILFFLQNIREATGGVFDSFFLKMSELGEGTITFLLMAAVYWCVDKRAGQLMGLNVSLACTWNQFLKGICKVERPWIRDSRVVPVQEALANAAGYSFPSGHTTRGTANWGALALALWKKNMRGLSLICWCVLGGIAFSRNYLGVHTPQDVLIALAVGIVFIFVFDWLLNWIERGKNRDLIVAGIGCLLCFFPMLRLGCLTNAGAGMGLLIGWILERRFIHFEIEGSWAQKSLRFSIGALGIVCCMTVLQSTLSLWMAAKYAGFFANFVLAFFLMAAYPLCFSRKRGKLLSVFLIGVGAVLCSIASVMKTELPENEYYGKTVVQQANKEDESLEKTISIIGHRGYSGELPENTLVSFRGAMDIGVDYIELDVQLSKDKAVVVYHDGNLEKITGKEGVVAEYTLNELKMLDAGSWFSDYFAGEKIPTLEEALDLISESDCKVYLELKDIGVVEGFEEAVLEATESTGMTDRCLFASFNYEYLMQLKELDEDIKVLYNTTSGKVSLPEEFPAEYYGLYVESVRAETIEAIHDAGSYAFVWTANTPEEMINIKELDADGIVTNYPGLAKIILQEDYSFLAEHYETSFAVPGLYGMGVEESKDMVMQGFTKTSDYLIVSAYSRSGENSILYLMDLDGNLKRIVDLGFKAHTGGVSYDEERDYLWITGPEGMVYALSWPDILSGTYSGQIQVSMDAGLTNHDGVKVASFLTVDADKLFVGSYVDGAEGILRCYDLSDGSEPILETEVAIPERIQGITFQTNRQSKERVMLLSQSHQTDDSKLLYFLWNEEKTAYDVPEQVWVLPEGLEQIQMTAKGLYLLFESAAWPYRDTARIRNDQLYLIRMPK